MYDIIADKILRGESRSSSSQPNLKSSLVILGSGLDCSKLTVALVQSQRVKYKEIIFIVSSNDLTRTKLCQSTIIEDLSQNMTVRKRNAKYIKGGIFFLTSVQFYFDLHERIFDPN